MLLPFNLYNSTIGYTVNILCFVLIMFLRHPEERKKDTHISVIVQNIAFIALIRIIYDLT